MTNTEYATAATLVLCPVVARLGRDIVALAERLSKIGATIEMRGDDMIISAPDDAGFEVSLIVGEWASANA